MLVDSLIGADYATASTLSHPRAMQRNGSALDAFDQGRSTPPAGMSPGADYPPEHWHIRHERFASRLGPMSRTAAICPEQPKLPPKRNPSSSRDGLAPARKLLKDIIDAGGAVERNVRDDKVNYRTLVGHINGRQMAPDGQRVIMIERVKPFHIKAAVVVGVGMEDRGASCHRVR